MSQSPDPTVRIAAVGDLLLAADPARPPRRLRGLQSTDAGGTRKGADIFANCGKLFDGCDVVCGNLECTLPGDGEKVPTQPRVIATRELVESIAPAGFNIVTLSNNHAFDCGEGGFEQTRRVLDEIGVVHFGAGRDLADACKPAMLTVKGMKLAFVGAIDAQYSVCRTAGPSRAGCRPFDLDEMCSQIRQIRAGADHVVVSLHWGQERFTVPSPRQVEQAHSLVDAGATLILGHHPHVLQGMETYRGVPIVYSLGNFVASEVPYEDGDRITWNARERTGCVFLAEMSADACVKASRIPTQDGGAGLGVDPVDHGEDGGYGRRLLVDADRAVASGVGPRRYRREVLWVKKILPQLNRLRWSQLRRLNLAKIKKRLAVK